MFSVIYFNLWYYLGYDVVVRYLGGREECKLSNSHLKSSIDKRKIVSPYNGWEIRNSKLKLSNLNISHFLSKNSHLNLKNPSDIQYTTKKDPKNSK